MSPKPIRKILCDAGKSTAGWSKYNIANRCLQLHALAYELGPEGLAMINDGGPALTRGSIGHVGLAQRYSRMLAARKGDEPDRYFTEEEGVRLTAGRFENGQKFIDPVLDVLHDYGLRYGEEDGLELLTVEHQLKGWMVGPGENALGEPRRYRYTQRGDIVVRDHAGVLNGAYSRGKICYIDHKFVGFLNKETIERYALDGQGCGYTWFGRKLHGADFGGAYLNLIEVSGRADKWRFRRVPWPPAPEAVREFPQTILDAGDNVARLKAEGRNPWTWPRRISAGACWTLWGPCPAHEFCRWGRKGPPKA